MTALTRPVRRVTDAATRMPHGFRQRLVLTLHPGAILEVRESGRRASIRLDIGTLYARACIAEAREKIKKGGRK